MNDNDFAAWNVELKDDGKGPTPLDDPEGLSDATADAMFSTMMETAYQLAKRIREPAAGHDDHRPLHALRRRTRGEHVRHPVRARQ